MSNKVSNCSYPAFSLTERQGRRLIRTRRSNVLPTRPGKSKIEGTRSAVAAASSSSSSSSSSSPILLPNSTESPAIDESIDTDFPSGEVEICHVETLPTENSPQEALTTLETAIAERQSQYSHVRSGLLRLEVPLPRSISALHWLRGQNGSTLPTENGVFSNDESEASSSGASLFPKILFSPRRSSAPDTEGSIAAGVASAGAGSVAGAGAAWLWKGQPGQPLDAKAMLSIRRFLKTDHPRVRVFGGSRFDPGSHPAPEWEEFGSYCFVLPRIELLELSGCSMLACTLAWDASSNSNNTNNTSSSGYNTFQNAAAAANIALHAIHPPSPPRAPAFRLTQHSMQHLPSEEEWATRLDAVHSQLVPATPSSSTITDVTFGTTNSTADMATENIDDYNGVRDNTNDSYDDMNGSSTTTAAATHPLQKLSPDVALEEYLRNGQQGLDELLAALESGFEAIVSTSESIDESSESDGDSSSTTTATANNENGSSNNGNGSNGNGLKQKKKKNSKISGNGSKQSGTGKGMSKIVLARRTDLHLEGHLDPLTLLEALQERDPRAYQIFLQLPSGTTFLASTPECLYTRSGSDVASEAVAGTRARGSGGDVEKDFWLAFDLLRSQKDDVEFGVVRDWVRRALGTVCDDVRVEITKSVLKQGSVQHLYGKLAGTLRPDIGDAALLAALHPTPAVCGQPRGDALKMLSEVETFDRGLYSGPFGWVSRDAAEFVVAIRSALVRPRQLPSSPSFSLSSSSSSSSRTLGINGIPSAYDVALFAGVGIVCGSDTASEWAELNLKISQFERLLKPGPAFSSAPNISSLWARVMVEELCRLGCNTFCVAPGSRSSPLTVAIASHPRAKIVPCIDERSLGFWALGYGRARGLPAVVVTSSGTAVANLLPAVVEASQSHVPMLLLTADRPFELRDTGANQTINQVNIFGSYTRWDCDLEAPLESTPAMTAIEKVGEAVRAACAAHAMPAGPVHLNCQFREPLAPAMEKFDDSTCLQGLEDWETNQKPYKTLPLSRKIIENGNGSASSLKSAASTAQSKKNIKELAALLRTAGKACRGLLIIGELVQPQDVAATVQLAQILGWPIAADVLSGIRVGAQPPHGASLNLISHFDHLLLDSTHWEVLKPDVVVQIGGHLTSKRVAQFLEWCSSSADSSAAAEKSKTSSSPLELTSWIFVSRAPLRQDQGPNVSLRVKATVPELLTAFQQQQQQQDGSRSSTEQESYCQLLQKLDTEASLAIDTALCEFVELTEPAVARVLSQELPPGEGLFIGNSMPIRDLDMYAMPAVRDVPAFHGDIDSIDPSTLIAWSPMGVVQAGVGAPVAANRGASGIDGVLSTAAGFADGLQRGTTLVVGDISFLHDVNGLNLLRSGDMRPPLTVVLVNNGGGGIFSFLPIVDHIPDEVFTPLWATPQNVDLAGMCRAHGIPHIKVASPEELRTALKSAWGLNRHSVIEAITDREANVIRHREIQAAVKDALSATFSSASLAFPVVPASGISRGGITGACCSKFELPLQSPVTTTAAPADSNGSSSSSGMLRQGIFIILDVMKSNNNGSTTFDISRVAGEVAPLPGLHKETLEQAHAQTQLVCELLSSAAASSSLGGALCLPENADHFGIWLKRMLAIDAKDLLPSVRFGLEGAVLSAMADASSASLAETLFSAVSPSFSLKEKLENSVGSSILVNAMIDPQGKWDLAYDMAIKCSILLNKQQGSPDQCIKIKVGRTANPLDDAAVVKTVYNVLSGRVKLRLDANRAWTLEQALQFGHALNSEDHRGGVVAHAVQYIEEPLRNPTIENLSEFYRRTMLNIALDESVDQGLFGLDTTTGSTVTTTAAPAIALPEGVTTLVIKPSVIGGFIPTLKLIQQVRTSVECVISSAFESPLGISQLAHLAAAVDSIYTAHLEHGNELDTRNALPPQYHGLGTGTWWDLKGQPTDVVVKISEKAFPCFEQQLYLKRLDELRTPERPAVLDLTAPTINSSNGSSICVEERLTVNVATDAGDYSFNFLETRPVSLSESKDTSTTSPTIVFLHGFLGQPEEWLPFMKAFSTTPTNPTVTAPECQPYRCLALSSPGHGSTVSPKQDPVTSSISSEYDAYSLESTAVAVEIALEKLGVTECIVIGYSLGARLALLLSSRQHEEEGKDKSNNSNSSKLKVSKVVSISGTPGIPADDVETRQQRAVQDVQRAEMLRNEGLEAFMSSWYAAPMWDTLTTQHPVVFDRILQNRKRGLEGLELSLSLTLEKMSPGRAPDVHPDLYRLSSQEQLPKMLLIAGEQDPKFVKIAEKLEKDLGNSENVQAVVVNNCGHTVHVEQPVVLLQILFNFLTTTLPQE